MKKFPLLLLLLACVFTSPSALGQALPANIIVILADDLGYGDVGFNGCPDIPTPNMDSIAANGALCTNGYVTHPFCSPSRAGLITGRYQQRFGYENQPTVDDTNPRLGLPLQELLLQQLLKPAGYVSGAIGKWHLGEALDMHPIERGFDEFFGVLGGRAFPGYYNAEVLRDDTPLIETEYLTDAFTREGVDFINRHATEPFFLYLAYTAVHSPYDVPPDGYMQRVGYITDPARRIYAAMTVALDDGVGQVLQTLQANNLLDNTLIFFLSDNGAPNTGGFTSNAPLRGYKEDMLEGGIRIPFAVQWTGRLPANTVYDDLVSSLDIVASAAAAAGVTLPTDRVYDGLNIIPYLAGEQVAPVRTLFWRWFGFGPDAPAGAQRYTIWAVRSGPLKLVAERAKAAQPPALYNLPNDIHEDNDLASAQPEDVAALQSLYNQWTLDTVPPLWQLSTRFRGLPLILAGDWNGFNINDSSPPWGLIRITAPGVDGTPDGFNWFTTTIHAATTGGDTTPGEHSFVLVGANTYHQQWGGATVNIDDATTLTFFRGNSLGPTNSITFDDGFYYSFRFLDPTDPPPVDLTIAVMKTSAPPVTVSRTGQIPAIPMPGDPITVSIATSQPKSVEEQIYLRWTTDTFITSQLIPATGSGSSYSATIPGQPDGTLVQYSIITSTADLTPYSTSGAIDSLILATTATFNAVPTLPTPTPTPTPIPTPTPPPIITSQPMDVTVAAGKRASFSVTATGTEPLSYQWTKNATTIVGATDVTYSTPHTTSADNGALFAVIVTNPGGSVTSNNATLTVTPPIPPAITTQPADTTVNVGQSATFSFTVTGTPVLHCQWTKNGTNITGATKRSYTTPPTTLEDNGALFAVTVTNRAGSVTSNNATLTVQ